MSDKIKLSLGIKYENNSSSGKHKFANRLIQSIAARHSDVISLVPRLDPSDVHITFDGKMKPGSKNIYRIDGIWINTLDKDRRSKNTSIADGLAAANGVIFQSEFCQEAVIKNLKYKPPNSVIIYNGADPSEFKLDTKHRPAKPSFITMCKWRPHKRLNDTVSGFIKSKVSQTCQLHVYGEVDSRVNHPNVIYHGWSTESQKILPWCIASVHISYLDWCPNAVVESLVAGVPVIYADSGGTPYLVRNDGFKISDRPWDFKDLNLYKKRSMNVGELSKAYEAALGAKKLVNRPDLYIDSIATKYAEYVKLIHNSSTRS